ncbi:MAG: M15 family metallopeptidase [bacterium]|nr:M15 family metallopeptidase [bacterium]
MKPIIPKEYLAVEKNRVEKAYQQDSWKKVSIKENNDPLTVVQRNCYPFYYHQNLSSDDRILLRTAVLDRFLCASNIAESFGFKLVIYDGWRSVTLQENLFWDYLKKLIATEFNHLLPSFQTAETPEAIKKVFDGLDVSQRSNLKFVNERYVSWPSTDSSCPSPHATGGAVDVWLHTLDASNTPVDMGAPFDSAEELAHAFYHWKKDRKQFVDDSTVCFHRDVIIYAMTMAGFSCYPYEFWHFNYGNQMDALVKGGVAQYGYIEP